MTGKNKTNIPKRRLTEAQSLKNYKPKIIQSKEVEPIYDDWYFQPDEDKEVVDEERS